MANSNLIFYLPIENFGVKSDYWCAYADFYEKYWGGPTPPFGVWFGNEYQEFRKALSSNLEIEDELIEDCFFLKDKNNKYYIAPLGSKEGAYLLYSENNIPLHWFMLFKEEERKNLYTHWGFNAITYDTKIDLCLDRLNQSSSIISAVLEKDKERKQNIPLIPKLAGLIEEIDKLKKTISVFDPRGFVVLNYGELCSFIHPYTIKNENSVWEISELLRLLKNEKFDEAESLLNVLLLKWDDIRSKASGDIDKSTIQ